MNAFERTAMSIFKKSSMNLSLGKEFGKAASKCCFMIYHSSQQLYFYKCSRLFEVSNNSLLISMTCINFNKVQPKNPPLSSSSISALVTYPKKHRFTAFFITEITMVKMRDME